MKKRARAPNCGNCNERRCVGSVNGVRTSAERDQEIAEAASTIAGRWKENGLLSGYESDPNSFRLESLRSSRRAGACDDAGDQGRGDGPASEEPANRGAR